MARYDGEGAVFENGRKFEHRQEKFGRVIIAQRPIVGSCRGISLLDNAVGGIPLI